MDIVRTQNYLALIVRKRQRQDLNLEPVQAVSPPPELTESQSVLSQQGQWQNPRVGLPLAAQNP